MAELTPLIEEKPPATKSDGNLLLLMCRPSVVNDALNPTPAELSTSAVKPVRSSFTPDGFPTSSDQVRSTDDRLGEEDNYEILGKVTVTVGPLIYVYDADPEKTSPVDLGFGDDSSGDWLFYQRFGIPKETPVASGQKFVLYPLNVGRPHTNQGVANERLTKTVAVAVNPPGVKTVTVA